MHTSIDRRLLDSVLEGERLDVEDLEALIREPEGIYLDFKDGKLLNNRNAAAMVRTHVAGFANAEGGLLVVGVSDGAGEPVERAFTPTVRPGGKRLPEWARNVLEPMAVWLAPAPRIQTVDVNGIDVLVVGVARAPALVPCSDSGELKYFLRIGDATLAAPPYLVSDLLLSRRVHPLLRVRINSQGSIYRNGHAIHFAFEVENDGIVPAKDVTVGVVSWASLPAPTPKCRPVPAGLLPFIDALEPLNPAIPNGDRLILTHATSRASSPMNLAAFEMGAAIGIGDIPLPETKADSSIQLRSALYVLADGHSPEWYQLDWTFAGHPALKIDGLTRLVGARPVVAWNPPVVQSTP